MKAMDYRSYQRGVALIVSLLFLLVVTVVSIIAASNSAMGLKMSANMADSYSSFQSAEAGVIAVLALGTDEANDPFDGVDNLDPFAAFNPDTDHPLRNLNDGADSVQVEVFVTNQATICPRSITGSSVGLFECDYYRVESEHVVPREARTQVQLGVVKTIIGSGNF
jgi:type IV pilus assembly protein PilX